MMTLLKRFVARQVLGRRRYQRLFQTLHRVALRGMNVGGGSYVADSGERHVLRVIRRLTGGKALTILDIGANVGDYTAMVAEEFPGAEIHSFEPSPRVFAQLSTRCTSMARLNNFGLSDSPRTLTLWSAPDRSGLGTLYERKLDHHDLHLDKSETVTVRTLDQYCQDQRIDAISLMKLDVEGHELAVLSGAARTLEREAVDFIQFEFGGCNIDSRTYFRDFFHLLNPRYRLYRVLSDGLWAVDHYDESLESFDTTNYLAVRRAAWPGELR